MALFPVILFLIILVQAPTALAVDNELVVYIGAHPDDIDLGMSGSLYKFDYGVHPIMWIVATEGGADSGEWQYDYNHGWVANDGRYNYYWWRHPDWTDFQRSFLSPDLSQKRIGWYKYYYMDQHTTYSHSSIWGTEYDWGTRAYLYAGVPYESYGSYYGAYGPQYQASYEAGPNYTYRYWFPDGNMNLKKQLYTDTLAQKIAAQINGFVTRKGYRKDMLDINSHAPEEVAKNADEHHDHAITGNAVRAAISILKTQYGFGTIGATWYTIYSPIDPKPGYTAYPEDISATKTLKETVSKACWETAYCATIFGGCPPWFTTWVNFPTDAGNWEYVVGVSY
jgi:hypothetical protein